MLIVHATAKDKKDFELEGRKICYAIHHWRMSYLAKLGFFTLGLYPKHVFASFYLNMLKSILVYIYIYIYIFVSLPFCLLLISEIYCVLALHVS